VHGQKDNLDVFLSLAYLPGSVYPVEQGHGDVRNDNIGPQLLRGGKQGTTVLDDIDRAEFRFEQAPDPLCNNSMIIGSSMRTCFMIPSSSAVSYDDYRPLVGYRVH
jgi:hypothetical protein